jgi:hypothetical protein
MNIFSLRCVGKFRKKLIWGVIKYQYNLRRNSCTKRLSGAIHCFQGDNSTKGEEELKAKFVLIIILLDLYQQPSALCYKTKVKASSDTIHRLLDCH